MLRSVEGAILRAANRRAVLRVLGVGLSYVLVEHSETKALAQSGDINLYAGRSGRFQFGANDVFVGGLVIPAVLAEDLEKSLVEIAKIQNYRIPLEFSTNSFNPKFYSEALNKVLSVSGVIFTGVKVIIPKVPKNPATWEYFRRKEETEIFSILADHQPLSIYTLLHDHSSDRSLYESILPNLPQNSKFNYIGSIKDATRLFQLSNVIAKSLHKPKRLTASSQPSSPNGNVNINELVRVTFEAFGIDTPVQEVSTQKLVLRMIQL